MKLMEICKIFVEFLKEYSGFTTVEFNIQNGNFEYDMMEVYHPLKKDEEGYMPETKTFYHNTFTSQDELTKGMYCLYVKTKTNLNKNNDRKKEVKNILDQLKEKGFKLNYCRYFCDCYYGILEKI